MDLEVDVAIVGGGISGLTAAMFVARSGLSVVVFDNDRSIVKRARLFNLPGQVELEGRHLLARLREQCAAAGAFLRAAKVTDVVAGEKFTVSADNGSSVSARFVVLAAGQGTLALPSLGVKTVLARQPLVKLNAVTNQWGETSVPGVWACGLIAGVPSQAVACAGSGASVAVEVVSRANGAFWVDHDVSAVIPVD